jgi:hypothetical protein
VARIGPVDQRIKAKDLIELWKGIKHLTPESAEDFSKDLARSRAILRDKCCKSGGWNGRI